MARNIVNLLSICSGTFNRRKLHKRPHGGRAKSKINIPGTVCGIQVEMVIPCEWTCVLALLVQMRGR